MDDYHQFLLSQRQRILEHITPSKDAIELQQLLDQLIAYQSSVRGRPITNIPSPSIHQVHFNNLPPSLEMAAEIDYRLTLLENYQINNAARISQLLLAGLQIPQPIIFSQLQIDYLSMLHQNPMMGTVQLAKEIGVSPRTIKREKNQLNAQYGLCVASMMDPHQFGLVHIGVQFRTKSLKSSQEIETRIYQEAKSNRILAFLHGFAFDVSQREGIISSFLPNQMQARNHFDQFIREINDLYCEEISIHYIQGCYVNLNFGSYNHVSQEWQATSDLRTEGTRRFIEEYGFQFPPPRGYIYRHNVLPFTPADWILILSLCEGLLERKDRRALLAQYDFAMAEKTVWAHERRLQKAQAYFPFLTFSRLFFDETICVIVKCEPTTIEFLHQFVTQFVMSRIQPIMDGIILFLGVPSGASSLTNQLTHTLLDLPGLKEVSVLRLKRDLPHLPSILTYQLWNPKTKQWSS